MFWIYIVFAVINVVSFIMMGIDKYKAKNHQWRISEGTLLLWALLGGGLGGMIGMQVFRHKTKHMKFIVIVPASALIQLGLLSYISGIIIK